MMPARKPFDYNIADSHSILYALRRPPDHTYIDTYIGKHENNKSQHAIESVDVFTGLIYMSKRFCIIFLLTGIVTSSFHSFMLNLFENTSVLEEWWSVFKRKMPSKTVVSPLIDHADVWTCFSIIIWLAATNMWSFLYHQKLQRKTDSLINLLNVGPIIIIVILSLCL